MHERQAAREATVLHRTYPSWPPTWLSLIKLYYVCTVVQRNILFTKSLDLYFIDFNDKDDATVYFDHLKSQIPIVAVTSDGKKMMSKFTILAKTATNESTFKDMVKIIWRMVKTISGTPPFRLSLMFLGIGAMCRSLASSSLGDQLPEWVINLEDWMGKQLTIGGKGVAGEGEGTANERIQRFFSTPYLHDFDWSNIDSNYSGPWGLFS